jgi:hypothetical protein
MVTCSNCSGEAFFAYVITASFNIPYCSKHLPKFLGTRSPSVVKISELPAATTSKKKKEPAVVEEPVVEEPSVEELIEEGELEVEEGI